MARPLLAALRAHSHLVVSVLAVVLVFGLSFAWSMAASWTISTRLLTAWNAGAWYFLATTLSMMWRANDATRRRNAIDQDPGGWGILAVIVAATAASLVAIVVELTDMRARGTVSFVPLCAVGLTILASFAFVHTAFALHYAHEHERAAADSLPGLRFPGESPDYFDFLYFAFVIGVAAQTADVVIESRALRRLALVHGVFAFFFNTSVLALAINTASSAF
jgi:uncharacterized membrane protein